MTARRAPGARLRPAAPPDPARLAAWIDRLAGRRALVWGDFVMDEYWRCRTSRVSREAPVLVLDWEAREVQFGGAANAALNLAALGAHVTAAGFVGDDAAGEELRRGLAAGGVDPAGLIPLADVATVVKVRVTAGSVHTARQQVVRIDRGQRFMPERAARAALAAALRSAGERAHVVILSDYGYDSVTPETAAPWTRVWTGHGAVVALDSRYRLARYRGVTLATPNESEAAAASGIEIVGDRELGRAAASLRRSLGAEHLLITRGRDGLTWWGPRDATSYAAWGDREAVDVTGAGDAVVAAAALALAAKAPAPVAAALANVAGSVAVSRRGAVAVRADDLRRALGRAGRRRPDARPGRIAARTARGGR